MEESKKIILIVDDIELNRAILCELFRSRYQIVEAENGKEALEAIARYGTDIAVMLLDVVMPVMDGIEVLHSMRKMQWHEKVPVILITAENNEDTSLQGYSLGVTDIINKPFNPDIVCRRVENVIELYNHKYNLEKMVQEQLGVLENQAQRLKQMNTFVIDTLSTVVEFRNGESGSHIKRIRRITHILLEAMSERYPQYRFSPDTIDSIASASAMHDIGKIAIPDAVLLKPGKLTADEYEIMKTHTLRGCEILKSLDYVQDGEYFDYCYEICRHHHERWDGNGYPDHLKGNEISIWAQVVSLADVYEALISERIYKPPFSHDEAIRMIEQGDCGVFNPQLLKCFQEISGILREELQTIENTPIIREIHRPVREVQKIEPLSDRTLRLLELEREKYRVLAEMSGEILFDYDRKTGILVFSEKYCEVFGESFQIPDARTAIRNTKKIGELDKQALFDVLKGLDPENSRCKIEIQLETMRGVREWFEVYVCALWEERHGGFSRLIGKLTNIHTVKTEAHRLREQAYTDPLTGLLNRKAVEEQITASLGDNHTGALIFIDLDNFKTVNDTYGHLYGDQILKEVGRTLKRLFRDSDILGRIGGDEFVVFLNRMDGVAAAEQRAQRVCQAFREAFRNLKYPCQVSGSLGISRFPEDGTDYRELLDKADRALYFAKNAGKDRFALFGLGMA